MIAVLANGDKPLALKAARRLIDLLCARGQTPIADHETARGIGRPELAADEPASFAEAKVAVIFGGDGTLLKAAKELAPFDLPLLGVNMGRLGFLTATTDQGLPTVLDQFLAGEATLEERLLIAAEAPGGHRYPALNDVVIKGPQAKMVRFRLWVGEVPVGNYAADGVIISTPTGSTAYSLSAGGPVVHPGLEVLLVTPICPHSLTARPLVVGDHEAVRVELMEPAVGALLTVDGQVEATLKAGQEVIVRRSSGRVRLVRPADYSFYQVLREKLSD